MELRRPHRAKARAVQCGARLLDVAICQQRVFQVRGMVDSKLPAFAARATLRRELDWPAEHDYGEPFPPRDELHSGSSGTTLCDGA